MATPLALSSSLTVTSHRSEVLGDLSGNDDQGRCAKKNVLLGNAWLGSGSLGRRHRGRSWQNQEGKKGLVLPCQALFGRNSQGDKNDANDDSSDKISNKETSEAFRQRMEQMVTRDEMPFRGIDLATLIRKKYGVSYDVQFIKKEFMGRQLLAMNVMWKYREQRSFPLTEEEYILHLDDIVNSLSMWGAVGLVRNSLEKTKERPRIGKAVSIFIDRDELGGRAREWIAR